MFKCLAAGTSAWWAADGVAKIVGQVRVHWRMRMRMRDASPTPPVIYIRRQFAAVKVIQLLSQHALLLAAATLGGQVWAWPRCDIMFNYVQLM